MRKATIADHAKWNRTLELRQGETYKKRRAGRLANAALRRGEIKYKPCHVCRNTESNMHHPNYDEPLVVIWLCQTCHNRVHGYIRQRKFPKWLYDNHRKADLAHVASLTRPIS